MHTLFLCVLFTIMVLSLADCGCGAKCAIYNDAAKCTRCCTATVKRSLHDSILPRRSQRFLLHQVTRPIRVPMWLASAAASSSSSSSSSSQTEALSVFKRRRRNRRILRNLLDQILEEAIDRNI